MRKSILLAVVLAIFITACATAPTSTATPATTESAAAVAQPGEKITVYAPASTSSIPVILAVSKLEGMQLTLYTNQQQANTLFLRGDANILVTGLSVGVDMVKNDAPVQQVNSFVSGLSYLLTYGKQINRFADLKGQEIYIPFKNSPIEEATAHLVQQAGLKWPDDFKPVYMPFESSVELLKQGKAGAVVLPEPYVSLLEKQPNIFISLSYFDEWQKSYPKDAGYPQVGALVKADWAQTHPAQIAQFNQALAEALTSVEQDPTGAVEAVKAQYKFPAETLLKSLNRTHFNLLSGDEMRQAVAGYYSLIGKPLNEKYANYFYIPAK